MDFTSNWFSATGSTRNRQVSAALVNLVSSVIASEKRKLGIFSGGGSCGTIADKS